MLLPPWGGVAATTNGTVHADVKSAGTEATNIEIDQAQQKVDQASQAVTTAQQADDQASDNQNKAQTAVDTAQKDADTANAAVENDTKAVSDAQDGVTTAKNHQSAVSDAIANQSQAQANLNQAQSDQAAINSENTNGQLNQAVSDAQATVNDAQTSQTAAQSANDQAQANLKTAQQNLANAGGVSQGTTQADVDAAQAAKSQAQEQKNTADQQVNADSAAVQTASSNVDIAKTAASQATDALSAAQETVNAKKQALQTAQQNLQNAQNQSGSTETAHKNVADILWIPDNFGTLMHGAFDEGAHLNQDQINMLHQLYTKNVNAFTDHMDEIMSDADYDTTYDLSRRSYNVEDKQGHGTNAGDELSVFAADVLNAFRSKLGMPLLKANSALNKYKDTEDYNQHNSLPPAGINSSTLTSKGQASAMIFNGTAQAYPIMNEPNTYSMDQLKYNLFLQLMQMVFEDNSNINTQGDHAATALGKSANDHNASQNSVQYISVNLNPNTGDGPATATTDISTFAPDDQAAKLLAPYDYTSKLDPASSNTSPTDLNQLQQAVDDAQQALQSASADRDAKSSAKQTADHDLSSAKQALTDAQNKLSQDKQVAQEAQDKLNEATQKLADVQ